MAGLGAASSGMTTTIHEYWNQNRADERRQVLADQQLQTVQQEEQQKQDLLRISNQILDLAKAIHAIDIARSADESA